MLFYKDFVMDIVVKIKQFLLVAFVMSNVQLIAMNLKNSDVSFEQKCKKAQEYIDKWVDKCEKKIIKEQKKFLTEKALHEMAVQSLTDYRKSIFLTDSMKNRLPEGEYNKRKEQEKKDYVIYKSIFSEQAERILVLGQAIKKRGDCLKKLQDNADKLNERKRRYELQKNEQQEKKRKLGVDNNKRELKKRKIDSAAELKKAHAADKQASQPCLKPLKTSSTNIMKNFSIKRK